MSMNLLVDESVDRLIVDRLRADGHDLVYVAELAAGISDDEVLRQANDRQAVLITADKDFGELVFRQGRIHAGVVLVRLGGLPNATKATVVSEVLRDRATEIEAAFTIISPGLVRIRHAPASPSEGAPQRDDG